MGRDEAVIRAYIRHQELEDQRLEQLNLLAAGILGLIYGGFTYTKNTREAKIGPLEMTVNQKETVNVPVWAGVGAIIVGAGLLLAVSRKS